MSSHQPRQQNTGSSAEILVTGSVVSGSQISAVSGEGNRTVITNQPGGAPDDASLVAVQRHLSAQLSGIRQQLLEIDLAARATDREDALEAVTELQADLGKPVIADRKTLRKRMKALVGALRPVADIVGGIAALEAIVRGL